MKICQTINLIEFLDGDISIESYSETGTFMGDVYITPDELPLLIKALQEIQNKRIDTESK